MNEKCQCDLVIYGVGEIAGLCGKRLYCDTVYNCGPKICRNIHDKDFNEMRCEYCLRNGKRKKMNDLVWIAGSRSKEIYPDELAGIFEKCGLVPKKVCHGGAKGIDTSAERWATKNRIGSVIIHADWEKYGKAAGPIRNGKLASKASCLLALVPAGRGTLSAIRSARSAKLPVIVWNLDKQNVENYYNMEILRTEE